MKNSRKIRLRIAEAFLLVLVTLNIIGFTNNVKWHNNGHPPTINGQVARKIGDNFVSSVSQNDGRKISICVSENMIEKNKDCRICRNNQSLLIRAAVSLGLINKESKPKQDEKIFGGEYTMTVMP